jgi:hypothetical protein
MHHGMRVRVKVVRLKLLAAHVQQTKLTRISDQDKCQAAGTGPATQATLGRLPVPVWGGGPA